MGKGKEKGVEMGKKDDFFLDSHFLVFKYLTYLPNVFSTICKRILSTFYTTPHPPPPPIIMATFTQFPRRSSVSAIAEEWNTIVRLWTLRKYADKQRDIYTHKRQPLFSRKTVKVKVSNSRTRSQVNKCLISSACNYPWHAYFYICIENLFADPSLENKQPGERMSFGFIFTRKSLPFSLPLKV